MQSLKLIITGRVQGVGFRHFIYKKARSLGLKGYVRNLSTGQVEILARGREADVAELIIATRKGPVFSNVTDVQIHTTDADTEMKYVDFVIEKDGY